jgi:hypothetical protein
VGVVGKGDSEAGTYPHEILNLPSVRGIRSMFCTTSASFTHVIDNVDGQATGSTTQFTSVDKSGARAFL